ncbi:MAG TPA: hypothetical protein VHG91_14280 [Longimicrobium sp.]|nr:hypothetical protein [Longimicrobium sp.]
MRLAPDDFLPLESFPLAWRWRADRSAIAWPLSDASAPWTVLWLHEEVMYVGRAVGAAGV